MTLRASYKRAQAGGSSVSSGVHSRDSSRVPATFVPELGLITGVATGS